MLVTKGPHCTKNQLVPMRAFLLTSLFEILSWLPLRVLHGAGALLGPLVYRSSPGYARRLRENLSLCCTGMSSAEFLEILRSSISEVGKALLELPWAWRRSLPEIESRVRGVSGWEHVEAAQASGRGVIFLTPHMGCFEVIALYVAMRWPLTVLYRPPKLGWIEPVMLAGRQRANLRLAKTDVSGVRALFKALKRGEAIGLLPDQVPGKGEGEWVQFFGKPAYTMTLPIRLAENTGALILMVYAERLPKGEGYALHFAPFEDVTVEGMNRALQETIRACPSQYLWSYNRYKVPAGVNPPDAGRA